MEHVLDNPAWNALTTGNSLLAYGNNSVKYFDREVSPFVGFGDNLMPDFGLLYDTLPHNGPAVLISPVKVEIPQQWKVLQAITCMQMVFDEHAPAEKPNMELVALTREHIPQMLALTQLTKPGPFALKTIDFGHYYGVFDGDKLVAMAGQRMHILNYTEVSAVCTHPDYLGRGYAKQVLLYQIQRMRTEGKTPILHVRDDNDRAIQVYQSLGFKTRIHLHFNILMKRA